MKAVAGETLLIRRYEPGDEQAVQDLHEKVLRAVGAYAEGHEEELDADLLDIGSAYLGSGGEFLVGVRGGGVVAMGALKRLSSEEAEVKRMRVAPGLQGRGFGQTMLEALEMRAAELGYRTLRPDTTVQQRAARGLHEKNGYRETRCGEIGPFACIFYEKELAR